MREKATIPSARKRIMLVDDEEEVAHVLARGIQFDDIAVSTFNDPLEALEEFKANPTDYELIITDIRMPRMNGFEFYHEIKKIRKQVSVWFLTASDFTSWEVSYMFPSVKVEKLLWKPISAQKLRGLVQEKIGANQTIT